MSSSHDSTHSSCADVAGLLLPFVDGEIGETESHLVLNHIAHCPDCNELVQEQQRVRAMLGQVSSPPPSANLLKRVHLALDEVDREAAHVPAPTPSTDSWRARLFAMLRGGMVMAPAAAAAGLLWMSLRPDATGPSAPAQPLYAQAEPAATTNLDANALPASLPPTILSPRGIPQDIEFVSAKPDVVRYRNPRRNFQLIDRHQRGAMPQPQNAKIHREGRATYLLSLDPKGYARLDFQLGPHIHRVMLIPDQAFTGPRAISAQDPHFAEMLRYARALQRTVQP